MVKTTSKNLFPVLLFLVGAAILLLYQTCSGAKVAHRQQTAIGIVMTHNAEDHDSYSYSFRVGQRLYTGRNGVPAKPPKVGDRITVFYDPENPSRNSLSGFGDISERTAAPLAFILAATALVAFLAIRQRTGRRP